MIRNVTSLTNKELEAEYVRKNTLYSFVNDKVLSFIKVVDNLNNKQIECNNLIKKLRNKKIRTDEDISTLFNLWRESQNLKMMSLIISRRSLWLTRKNKFLGNKLWDIYNEMVVRDAESKNANTKK